MADTQLLVLPAARADAVPRAGMDAIATRERATDWTLYSPPPIRSLAPMCLFTLTCVLVASNTQEGRSHGRERRSRMQAFGQDLQAGVYKMTPFSANFRYPPCRYPRIT